MRKESFKQISLLVAFPDFLTSMCMPHLHLVELALIMQILATIFYVLQRKACLEPCEENRVITMVFLLGDKPHDRLRRLDSQQVVPRNGRHRRVFFSVHHQCIILQKR